MRIAKLTVLLAALAAGGCSGTLEPEALDATGHWTAQEGKSDPQWQFELVEEEGGGIGGSWNSRNRFIGGVHGKRLGREVYLVPDSPNAFHVTVHATFVGEDRMEGRMEADNQVYNVVLLRR